MTTAIQRKRNISNAANDLTQSILAEINRYFAVATLLPHQEQDLRCRIQAIAAYDLIEAAKCDDSPSVNLSRAKAEVREAINSLELAKQFLNDAD